MAIESAQCFGCGGHASLSEHNARHGWACPHCGQSHWPSSGGWAAATSGPNAATVTSGISPTRAAAAGYSATLDLTTNKGILSSPAARFAARLAIVVAAAATALIARTLLA